MATKAEIIQDSNNTYVPNTSGLVTPQTVQTLNTDWINASIFPEQTGSMTVATASFALTASVLIGNATSASLAANSLLLQGTGSNGFATTASLTAVSSSGQQVSASYIALSASYNVFSGSASTRLTNTSQSLQSVSASGQQVSASYIALSESYDVFSGSASTRLTNTSQSLQSVSASGQQVSASYIALSGSYNTFSGSASTRITANSSSIQSVSASTQQVSASYIALSASYNVFSGSASTRITNTEVTASNLVAASASFSTRVSDNTSNIQTLTSATASYAVLGNNQTFTGKNTFNNDVTASNVRITGTASIAFLDVQFQSSSVIYSSGSNQFGDASNDTQTLWGTVNVISGPLVVTGSANFKETITGSISGNAATATSSTSASYAFTASSAVNAASSISASYAYTASSAVNATSASFATTASFALNGGGGAAFPFTGSAVITGSLELTGSANISGSLIMFSYRATPASTRGFETMVTQSLGDSNNIISIVNSTSSNTGSIIISGSGNYVSLANLGANSSFINGATTGFYGVNAYVTTLPITTGSNPNYNTATDRNNRRVPSISNSNVNSTITVVDNRASLTTTPVSISNSSINSTITANIGSGSLTISNANIAGTTLQLFVSNSFGGNASHQISQNIIAGSSIVITGQASGSRSPGVTNSIIGGAGIRLLLSASIATNPRIDSSLIVGDNLVITSSWYMNGFSNIAVGSAFLGSFNKTDGILNNPEHTRFAIGTGIGDASGNRRTSLAVSSSGLTTIFDGLVVSGSTVAQAISSSFSGSGALVSV